MQCYFLREGQVVDVETLPLGLSDEDAITEAHTLLSAKRKGPDSFQIWDNTRLVISSPSGGDLLRR